MEKCQTKSRKYLVQQEPLARGIDILFSSCYGAKAFAAAERTWILCGFRGFFVVSVFSRAVARPAAQLRPCRRTP